MKLHLNLRKIFLMASAIIPLTLNFAQAEECNGWHTLWCRDHYGAEIASLGTAIRANENRKDHQLPADIEVKRSAIALANAELTAARNLEAMQMRHYSAVSGLGSTFQTILNSTRLAKEAAARISPEVIRNIPILVQQFRLFFTGYESLVQGRLIEIARLLQENPSASVAETLRFEEARLRDLTILRGRYRSTIEVRVALRTAFSTANQVNRDVSPETAAIARMAFDAQSQYSTEYATRLALQQHLADIENNVLILVRNNEAIVNQASGEHSLLAQDVVNKTAVLRRLEAEMAALITELNTTLPSVLETQRARFNSVVRYQHCCDNTPGCTVLPDAGQEAGHYAIYEGVVDRFPDRCLQGPE